MAIFVLSYFRAFVIDSISSHHNSITKTRKYENTKKSRTGTLPCLGCQRPAANTAFWEWTRVAIDGPFEAVLGKTRRTEF